MGLKLYYKNNLDVFVEASIGDDTSDPITTTHDGKNGDVATVDLYVRNDDATKWYSNIIITPYDLIDADPYGDVGYSETGWGVKLNPGGTEPTGTEWEDINWGEAISMTDVGSDSGADTTTYFPFWYLITCPPNIDAQNKEDIVLRVDYTENVVP